MEGKTIKFYRFTSFGEVVFFKAFTKKQIGKTYRISQRTLRKNCHAITEEFCGPIDYDLTTDKEPKPLTHMF